MKPCVAKNRWRAALLNTKKLEGLNECGGQYCVFHIQKIPLFIWWNVQKKFSNACWTTASQSISKYKPKSQSGFYYELAQKNWFSCLSCSCNHFSSLLFVETFFLLQFYIYTFSQSDMNEMNTHRIECFYPILFFAIVFLLSINNATANVRYSVYCRCTIYLKQHFFCCNTLLHNINKSHQYFVVHVVMVYTLM